MNSFKRGLTGRERAWVNIFSHIPYPAAQSSLSTTAAQVHSSPTASSSEMTSSPSSEEEESTSGAGGEGGGVGCPVKVTSVSPKCEPECAKQFLHEMIRNHKY